MKKTIFALTAIALSVPSISNAGDGYYGLIGGAYSNEAKGAMLTIGTHVKDNWHVEVGFTGLYKDREFSGTVDDNSYYPTDYELDLEASAGLFTIAPVYKYDITNNFGLYAKAGLYYGDYDLNHVLYVDDDVWSKGEHRYTSHGFTYGIGAEMKSTSTVIGSAKAYARFGIDWYDFGKQFGVDVGTKHVIGLQVGLGY